MNLAVTESKTTVTEVFGVGPFVACAVMGHVGDISRFDSQAAFAAYNGTARRWEGGLHRWSLGRRMGGDTL